MAKEYSKDFYNSSAWTSIRETYLREKRFICEGCGGYADTVHHIVPINPDNITDASITLDYKNLKAVCRQCHSLEHARLNKRKRTFERRYIVGENGKIICK